MWTIMCEFIMVTCYPLRRGSSKDGDLWSLQSSDLITHPPETLSTQGGFIGHIVLSKSFC